MQESFEHLQSLANANLLKLGENQYPGRGIIVGLDETEEFMVQVYWIMGRSESSRNRVFVCGENGLLATEAADKAKAGGTALTIYNAMREDQKGWFVVSNGHQTDAVVTQWDKVLNVLELMRSWQYEPDSPNCTPRITAVSFWRHDRVPGAWMSILRKSPWSDECDRHLYELNHLGKGFGHCITTYSGDGKPLPSFHGEPILLPLLGGMGQIADAYWRTLNPDNRVALAVKFISREGSSTIAIINKYARVEARIC